MTYRRRYLTFSLRTLFILLTALAVWLGVVVHRVREQRETVKAIEGLGGYVVYDWDQKGFDLKRIIAPDRGEPPGPSWLRRLIGDDFFQNVDMVYFGLSRPSSEGEVLTALPYLKRLPGLMSIWVLFPLSRKAVDSLHTHIPDCDLMVEALPDP